MFVILDLSGLLPGSHAVKPRVVLPPGIEEEGLLPETVEVVIVSTVTETPDPSKVITPTITSTIMPALTPTLTATVAAPPVATPGQKVTACE